jgi:hypothetical protein
MRKMERTMAGVTDLEATINERRSRLDQVDQALAEIRRLAAAAKGHEAVVVTPRKRKWRPRQLRLPLTEPGKKA